MADSLVRGKNASFKTAAYSIAGNQKLLEGKVLPTIVSASDGIERFSQYDHLFTDIDKMVRESTHSLFAEAYASQLEWTLARETLGSLLDNTLLDAGATNMPTDDLVRYNRMNDLHSPFQPRSKREKRPFCVERCYIPLVTGGTLPLSFPRLTAHIVSRVNNSTKSASS